MCSYGGQIRPTNPAQRRSLRVSTLREQNYKPMTQKALIVRTGPDGHEGLKQLTHSPG